jgi:hypothetical protein
MTATPVMPAVTSTSEASSGGDAVLTFAIGTIETMRKRREVRERASAGLSVVLAASTVPLLVLAVLAVAALLT